MPRSVNSVAAKARRKKIIKIAKGYYGRRKNIHTVDKNDVEKDKKRSKYSIVILKDGRRINNKKRRKKSENKLFKKKMY